MTKETYFRIPIPFTNYNVTLKSTYRRSNDLSNLDIDSPPSLINYNNGCGRGSAGGPLGRGGFREILY